MEPEATDSTKQPLFGSGKPERTSPSLTPWFVAGLVVLLGLGGLLLASKQKPRLDPSTILPLAAQASSLSISQIVMSESTSLSGGKSTYIDGHIKNSGTHTLTAATVQVLFANDEQLPPQVVTLPLALIRTRQPYVDTEPISAEPLAPGDDREFRLIFEGIGLNWNQQLPAIHIIAVTER